MVGALLELALTIFGGTDTPVLICFGLKIDLLWPNLMTRVLAACKTLAPGKLVDIPRPSLFYRRVDM